MKIQYIAVLFVLIIFPITIVLSAYVDYNEEIIDLRNTYNTKLLDATYDCIKSYQISTINNAISDVSTSKIEELEAAVKTFFNSLSTNYGYIGYKSSMMEDHVPAVVFTMYDGYYLYSPYQNVLSGVSEPVDEEYDNNSILHGIKPYVYYSCRYVRSNVDVIITYTLDNYITIQGMVDGEYWNESGYLMNGISPVRR